MMKNYAKLVEHTNSAPIKRNMFILYMVFWCISHFYVSGGRIVQGMIGGNVSLSWTFNVKNDAVIIYHGSTPFLWAWPAKSQSPPTDERLRIIREKSTDNAVTVTISIINVTQNDAGIYQVKRQFNSEEFTDGMFLEILGDNNFTTVAVTTRKDTELTDFLSTKYFLYVVLGIGAILAVGLLTCLLQKFRACSRGNRARNSNSLPEDNTDCEVENHEEQNPSESYWTIARNAKGELSTAIEPNIEQHRKTKPVFKRNFLKQNKSEQSINVIDVNVAMELEECMPLIHSHPVEHVDYIHPVHSGQ